MYTRFFVSNAIDIYFSPSEAGKSHIQAWQNHFHRVVNESDLILESLISALEKKYKKLKNLKYPDPDTSLKIMAEKLIA
jgi:hypothetical protein